MKLGQYIPFSFWPQFLVDNFLEKLEGSFADHLQLTRAVQDPRRLRDLVLAQQQQTAVEVELGRDAPRLVGLAEGRRGALEVARVEERHAEGAPCPSG